MSKRTQKLDTKPVKDAVRFLRSIGEKANIDLRSVSKLSPQKKGALTRKINQFSNQFETWKRFPKSKKIFDYVKSKDEEELTLARDVWGESAIIEGKGYFVPRGLLVSTLSVSGSTPKVSTKDGITTISRKLGGRNETYFPTDKKPQFWKDKDVDKFLKKAFKVAKGKRGVRFGFVVGNSISRKFYNQDGLIRALNQYKGQKNLDIKAIVVSSISKKTTNTRKKKTWRNKINLRT